MAVVAFFLTSNLYSLFDHFNLHYIHIFDLRNGKRFSNELGRRDYVTGRMWANEGPFRLCLNKKASTEIAWHCKHYKSRGLMKHFKSFEEACKDSGTMDLETVKKTFAEHNEIDNKMQADGGKYVFSIHFLLILLI